MAAESQIALNDRTEQIFDLGKVSQEWSREEQNAEKEREREFRRGRDRNSEPEVVREIISTPLPSTKIVLLFFFFLPKILELVWSSHQTCDARLEGGGCINFSQI